MTPLLWTFLGAALSTAMLTLVVRALAHRLGHFERRGDPLAHAGPTPRLGGVGIALTWASTLLIVSRYGADSIREPLNALPLVPIVAAAMVVFAIGLLDDLRPVSPGIKITVEALATGALIGAGIVIAQFTVFGVTIGLGWLSIVVTMAWVLCITNAFNLIDGLDGLATGLAIIAGVTCAAIVILRGDMGTAVLLVALVGALAGFLPFNFNPASIFLGDGGSLFIGFVLALTAITGFQKEATALAVGVPLLIFALPLLDVVVTVVRRFRGAPTTADRRLLSSLSRLLEADRNHIHHQLMSRGLSHKSTVLVLYAVAVCLAALAFTTIAR